MHYLKLFSGKLIGQWAAILYATELEPASEQVSSPAYSFIGPNHTLYYYGGLHYVQDWNTDFFSCPKNNIYTYINDSSFSVNDSVSQVDCKVYRV